MERAARSTFEINNDVQVLSGPESIFLWDEKPLTDQEPWTTDPHYFQTVKISAVALIKMAMHARSGGQYEIMGVMYGKVRDHAFWITDAFALPVQGTETRVSAGDEAMEYMVQFQSANHDAGKNEHQRGWYHSHPGYGCWLSGIDVSTQAKNQKFFDPYLAVVIDPNRTIATGKVEIGAFRTYPEGYTPPSAQASEYQSIPLDKIEDFGVHADAYYPLKVEVYKTKTDEKLLDLLWHKYWVATLSQSPVLSNRAFNTSQINDLNAKLLWQENKLHASAELKLKAQPPKGEKPSQGDKDKARKLDSAEHKGHDGKDGDYTGVEQVRGALAGPTKDATRIANETKNAMTVQLVKDQLFNRSLDEKLEPAVALGAVQGAWTHA